MKPEETMNAKSLREAIDSVMEQDCPELPVLQDAEADESDEDGSVEFFLSDDKMNLSASFFPPRGNGQALNKAEVLVRLLKEEIEPDLIDEEAIDKALWSCREDASTVRDVIVARGVPPTSGEKEHVELLLNPKQYIRAVNMFRLQLQKEKINHKNITYLCILEKDTPVAVRYESKSGTKGKNVKGEAIPCEERQFESIKIGENLRVDESGDVYTDKQGEFIFENGTISVNEVLSLKEGVNYRTGNIHFPGAVEIYGEVKDGFILQVGKDLHIYETLSATDVLCGGNLIIHGGGIIGRKEHKVIVEKEAQTNFVERVYLEAKEGIKIKSEAYLSNLYTKGKIIFSPGGKLIGGETYTQNGLEVGDIGNAGYLKTEIYSGIDYKLMKMLIQIKSFRDSLINSGKDQKGIENSGNFDEQILKCNLSMEYLLNHLDNNESSEIQVSGTAYPGSVIHICNARYDVRKELKAGTFKLNKKSGMIEFIPH